MRALTLILATIAMLAMSCSGEAGQRVALVVGNGGYRNFPALPNAQGSARAMSRFLRDAGFDVAEMTNLPRDRLTDELLKFGQKAKGADIALFYYSGHVVGIDSETYLLPVDADIKSEMDIKLGAGIDLDPALTQALSGAKAKLIFLDVSQQAERIRYARVRGTLGMTLSDDMLAGFAVDLEGFAVDDTVRPFTRALIANIAVSGVELQQAMTRVRAQVRAEVSDRGLPSVSTNLTTAICLNPVAPSQAK